MNRDKLYVLALDGVPFTFLKKMIGDGIMPHLEKLSKDNSFKEMNSVIPPVSSSAWASFLTGKSPDQHGILSFTERDPDTMEWYTPDSRYLKVKTILEELSDKGKKVFSMNVPVTYPPKPVNGVSICGFLGNNIEKGTYPVQEGIFLKSRGYRIDSDTELAKSDLAAFIKDIKHVLKKRTEIMWHYLVKDNWDFFIFHIMETDRLFHFTWEFFQNNDPLFIKIYRDFFSDLDNIIGEVISSVGDSMHLLLLSDHGFTTLKQEVYLNRWLWEKDYLKFSKPYPNDLKDIHPESLAYALYPGRIFINTLGREKSGKVRPGAEYEKVRQDLKKGLAKLFSPDGEKVVQTIKNAEEVYPLKYIDNRYQADLFVFANEGYDLKGQLWHSTIFTKGIFNGMHTYNNAFVLSTAFNFGDSEIAIPDLAEYIYKVLKVQHITGDKLN